ncbi:PAN domain-containing protein [Hibiscus syriacus]|uniref:PAN domain-containing protein n=1 Tax=Hibiscus syriacus TaxID=106335 RepID=A0A6A2XGJ2_HIBSY|nr:PAN domain-containing protein At5g03700-like [Hibiscus syriacus]KAE8666285.1 PAN domain-containing protein [Hibiscus syriacus]
MGRSFNSVTRPRSTLILFLLIIPFLCMLTWPCTAAAAQELHKGFEANPNPSISSFQPLLNDSSGKFSFGLLRVNSTQLALAVLHVPSSETLWIANSTTLPRWSDHTKVFFNGSLVISDPRTRTFWSTQTQGDKLVLLNNSNLQIQKALDNSNNFPTILWQSFDHPTNTLVETQNFTSTMTIVSSNGLYSMRLGNYFIGLYAKFDSDSDQIYWKHKALQARAQIIEGGGPIHVRVDPDGWLGMYQNETAPVDVESFNSFQRTLEGLLMVRLEPDGNLKAYYWSGSSWGLDYEAITDTCELPNPCGSYGLCTPGTGCSCMDNTTEFSSGSCSGSASYSYDPCTDPKSQNDIKISRRKGVDVPFKELMRYETTPSLEECENTCEMNCSCYGSVYNNASGFCYILDYPIQTLLGTGDDSKVGYFKIREEAKKKRIYPGLGVGIGLLGAALLCLIGAIGFGSYKIWVNKRRVNRILEEETGGAMSGPYKDLGSASFRSIEMCSGSHR